MPVQAASRRCGCHDDTRGLRGQGVEHPRASGSHLEVRLESSVGIDLRRWKWQHLPLDDGCR